MTLVQAQERYINRVLSCQTNHIRRVRLAAWKQLAKWAENHGYDGRVVCKDADDVMKLERDCEEV